MAVIVVGSQKGGVGKTTVATNLAAWLSSKGRDVLLVDADDQGSASDFSSYREQTKGSTGYTLVQINGAHVRKQVEALRPKYDHIVIDTGGRDTTSQRAAMYICDIFLSPFNPRSYDLWTVTKVVDLIEEVQTMRPEPMQAYSFINRADIRSQDNRDMSEALLTYESLTFLPFQLSNRKAFANSAAVGLAVFEVEQPDAKAVAELDTLFSYITNGINAPATANKKQPADEATIDAFINGGGQPAPTPASQETFNPDTVRHINMRLTDGIIKEIDELRAKRPKKIGSPKLGISLRDWIVEAVLEKLERDKKLSKKDKLG